MHTVQVDGKTVRFNERAIRRALLVRLFLKAPGRRLGFKEIVRACYPEYGGQTPDNVILTNARKLLSRTRIDLQRQLGGGEFLFWLPTSKVFIFKLEDQPVREARRA